MDTQEKRVLEALTAIGPIDDVKKLAEKLKVTRQSVYDWLAGRSITNMKGTNLLKIAELSGFEALWIMEGKGPKRKKLTDAEQRVLFVMQQSEEKQTLVHDLVESVIKHDKSHNNDGVEDLYVTSDYEMIDQSSDKRETK